MTNRPKLTKLIAILSILAVYLAGINSVYADNATLNQNMSKIGEAMGKLLPLIVNEHSLRDQKNRAFVINNLSIIQNALLKSKSHFQNKSVTYQISFEVINQHINKLMDVYKQGHYYQAKSMLKATGSICASCHTQDIEERKLFGGLSRSHFPNDYEFAEFNYITRNYNAALKYYLIYFTSFKTHQQEKYQLIAIKNILTIYAQIYHSPQKAVEQFQTLLKNHRLSNYSRKTIEDWLLELKTLSRESGKNNTLSFTSIQSDVNKYLLPNNSVSDIAYHVWIKGRLYRYLSSAASPKQIPALLYWLAIANNLTDTNHYFSLAELYLKQCIIKYTSDPYAKKCFNQYKENIEFSYSGSRGTDIPEDIQNELDQFFQLVFKP